MTAPDAKHMEAARALIEERIDSMCLTWDHSFGMLDEKQRDYLRRCFRQVAQHDIIPFVARALAAAEREGMKRAAEIVKTGGTYPITRDSLAAAILSEAGEDA